MRLLPRSTSSATGAALAAFAAALLVASPVASGATISTAAYVKRANAICANGSKQAKAVTEPTDAAGVPAYLHAILTAVDGQYRALARLPRPARHAADAAAALEVGHRGTEILRQTIADIDGGADAVQALDAMARQLTPLSKREDKLWRAVGARKCAA